MTDNGWHPSDRQAYYDWLDSPETPPTTDPDFVEKVWLAASDRARRDVVERMRQVIREQRP